MKNSPNTSDAGADMFPTTRKYPRTLQEAFPQDYYDWLERPEPDYTGRIAIVLVVATILGLVIALWLR